MPTPGKDNRLKAIHATRNNAADAIDAVILELNENPKYANIEIVSTDVTHAATYAPPIVFEGQTMQYQTYEHWSTAVVWYREQM